MPTPVKVPPCYGHLYSLTDKSCMACLLNSDCAKAKERPKVPQNVDSEEADLPKDKKRLILAVCHKYGVSTEYTPRGGNVPMEITEESVDDFFNLDFLLTTKPALKKLLTARMD